MVQTKPLRTMKHMAKKAKWSLKSGFLGVKCWCWDLKNCEPATKLES